MTDGVGAPFDFPGLVHTLRVSPDERLTVIAAATAELHSDILASLGAA